jgi:hypothetical protein
MEKKEKALVNAIESLNALQTSIQGDKLESNEKVISQINQYVNRLHDLFDEARNVDEFSLFPIPLPLFDQVDQSEECNPELYQFKLLEGTLGVTQQIKTKSQYLEVNFLFRALCLFAINYFSFRISKTKSKME